MVDFNHLVIMWFQFLQVLQVNLLVVDFVAILEGDLFEISTIYVALQVADYYSDFFGYLVTLVIYSFTITFAPTWVPTFIPTSFVLFVWAIDSILVADWIEFSQYAPFFEVTDYVQVATEVAIKVACQVVQGAKQSRNILSTKLWRRG